jgi:hypothetical protein
MPLVIKSSEDDKLAPHLALCHQAQGYSANNRHVSLLMKSDVEMTEEIKKALETLGLSDVNKAAFYSQVRTLLQNAVKEKYGDEKDWLYVEDFNDNVVIFCNDKGLWSTDYSVVNGEVSLGELANPVTSVLSYVPATGNMLLSEDAEDKLEEGVYTLVAKALDNATTRQHLVDMFKSKEKEVLALQEEIQKAVKAAEDILKSQLQEKETELQKALDKLADIEKAQKEAVAAVRKEALAKHVPSEEVEEMFKAVGELPEEAFAVVVKSLEKKSAVEQESDLFKEKGIDGEGKVVEQEKAGLDLVAKLIEKQKTKKQ